MNFIFEWSTRYLTSERSERVRYRVEHEKMKFISISGHVIFCLLYKLTYDDIIDYFPKITEDFRGFPKIAEEDPIMFRSYSKTSGYFLRDYVAKAKVIMLSSRAKISCYLHV